MPFSLVPPKVLFGLEHHFRGPGRVALFFERSLEEDLLRAGYGMDPLAYASACALNAALNFVAVCASLLALGFAFHRDVLVIALLVGAAFSAAALLTCLWSPQIRASKSQRAIESSLIPVTRQMLIQVRSGVPLFNAIVSASTGNHAVCGEFDAVVKKLSAGVSEGDALAEVSASSPSPKFRKVAWQLSNALKTGSDLGAVLQSTLAELEMEQAERIQRYSQELSPLTVVYMLAAVIVPSLGITMFIVISSLLSFSVPVFALPVVFLCMLGFQFFFLDFASSRRPPV